jgi:hypothetical protein
MNNILQIKKKTQKLGNVVTTACPAPTYFGLVWFMVFNTTFKNISVILWQSVLLVEETVVPGENH